MHSIELETQAQHETNMRIRKATEYFVNDPLTTVDMIAGVVGLGTTYIGYAAVGAGVSIPIAGQIALGTVGIVCGIWGIGRLIYVAIDS